QVVIPEGLNPKEVGRDVWQSFGAILACRPSNADPTRFIARKYRRTSKAVTFEIVAAVRLFAHLGRLDEIDQVNPKSKEFHSTVVSAYDLLEVARRDAMVGLATLCGAPDDFDE